MEAFCRQNPSDNPYWCNIIWGYCQFQVDDFINEKCPIYQGFPKWPVIVDDFDDEFLQVHGYATIYDDGKKLVSLGDTAFQMYPDTLSIIVPYVRYIGKYAFQDCTKLKCVDFSHKTDDFIPVLASPEAFMLSDGSGFVNGTFKIKVPSRLYAEWVKAPNWTAVKDHIEGV